MPNPENIIGHSWKPGQSGNPKGRPKKCVSEIMVATLKLKRKRDLPDGLTRTDVDNWEEMLMSASSDIITILAQDSNIPIYARTLARAIAIDLKNGKTTTIDKLRDRRFGKTAQRVELTGKDGADLVQPRRLTKEEAKDLLDTMEKEY